MRYPLENLASDKEFEYLVALICERILGFGTNIFSVGKDGGKDGKFVGTANKFPSETKPWSGKIIMGYIKEPNGVTLVVDKKQLTTEIEQRIREFIEKSKQKNKDFIERITKKKND